MKRTLLLICTLLCANVLMAQTTFMIDSLGYRVTSISPAEVEVYNACDSITTANIPATVSYNGITYSVTSIKDWGFYFCYGLTSITIPNSVTSIGESAFEYCSSLTTLNFNAINCSDFNHGSSSYESSPFYNLPITTINIGDSVQRIPANFAYNLDSLTSISIPNSVTSIGDWAFGFCSSLTSIIIPNSVTSVGGAVFYGCNNLTSVILSNNITSLSTYYGNYNYYYGFFEGCSSLTSIDIPNSVTSIGEKAFYNCSSLISITIPNSVTFIGNKAFQGCNGLSILNFNAINCGDFTTSSNYPFAGCPFIVINIGDSVERIPDYFAFDKNLLTSISVPNSVTEIGNNAFDSCSALTSVILGDGLSTLPANAFANCNDILYITLGSGFASLPANAFSHCLLLQGVTSNAVVPPLCSSTVFPYPNTATLTVPCGSLEAYSAQTSIWSILFADRIEEDCSGIEQAETESISFFPNPTKSEITFSQVIEKVEVIDLTGKTIFTFSNAKTINIESLPAGAYYLRLTNNDKTIIRKVIKE